MGTVRKSYIRTKQVIMGMARLRLLRFMEVKDEGGDKSK